MDFNCKYKITVTSSNTHYGKQNFRKKYYATSSRDNALKGCMACNLHMINVW